ncbi:hypothetical protein A8B78_10640 [Jannaschia sp. EhC01]|nr:hypothetical protein A8B78_10640 [Jannaschia sp. EhC01]
MVHKTTTGKGPRSTKPGREDRLKAALKANMARRKAQARARTGADEEAARTGANEQDARTGANEQAARTGTDEMAQGQDAQDQAGKPADM